MDAKIITDSVQNKNFMMLLAAFIFMCGILACFYNSAVLTSIILTVSLIGLMYLKIFDIKRIILLYVIFYAGFFLTFCKIQNYDDLLQLTPSNVKLTGRIVSIPKTNEYEKTKFIFAVEECNQQSTNAKTLVTLSDIQALEKPLNIGERFTITGQLRKPFTSTNPSQFDYSAYLRNFNIFTTLYADAQDITLLKSNKSYKWEFLGELNKMRNQILDVHSKYLKSPNLEILGGIVFGDDAISPPGYIKNSFINSGLLHILAASGMNVALIFTFWFYLLQFFKIPYKARILSGILVVILYTLMTGLGASVIRAALMLIFVLIGKLIDRDAHSVALLAFVASIMLIYNPAYINDVSFQLSFMVTLGLLLSVNTIAEKLPSVPNWIKVPIIIPVIAQIWVAPIQMFYFNSFSLYSVFANIASVSLISVISFGGFLSSVISIFPPFADFTCFTFDFYLNYLLNILVYISDFFANLKNCLLQTSHPSIFQLILYYTTVLSITFLFKFNKFKQAFITLLIMSVIIFITTVKPVSNNLEIIAFDVQNADSFLIKTPKNKYFMIDTGKSTFQSGNSQANIIMLKYLKDNGIKNLEGVIVTHFDNDHSGGAPEVITQTNTKTLYLNSTKIDTQTGVNVYKTIRQIKQPYKIVSNNNEIYSEQDLKIKTFKANITGKDESNGNSIITLLSYKDFDMLFMGDAGLEAFNQIKKDIPHNIEILKVGHHGGPNVVDKNMLTHLNNKISLISTGINYFGHPNRGTLDILRNTDILRTDLLNAIKISSDGNSYQTYSYAPDKGKFIQLEKYNTEK